MNLRLEDARGQCYDEASAMSGCKKGVAAVTKSISEKYLFTHCYGHALNLAVGDCIRNEKLLAETFDTIKEVCNFVKKSPKRDTHLKMLGDLAENENNSVHAFCPIRWTIRHFQMLIILKSSFFVWCTAVLFHFLLKLAML